MFKIFFAVFFIAEMIIALAVILKIYQLDKKVVTLNKAVLKSQNRIKSAFYDIRTLFEDFNRGLLEIKELIRKKREEYMIMISKKLLILSGILLLNGKWSKYKNMLIGYHVGKEFFEGLKDSEIYS